MDRSWRQDENPDRAGLGGMHRPPVRRCAMRGKSMLCRRGVVAGSVIIASVAFLAPAAQAALRFREFAVPTLDSAPFQITAGPDGNLWFTELYGGKIGRITTEGTIFPACLHPAEAFGLEHATATQVRRCASCDRPSDLRGECSADRKEIAAFPHPVG